ncbi:MAG: hypothetical protein WC838_07785, partial [Candidatus Margulisiibacteriota bacterium]
MRRSLLSFLALVILCVSAYAVPNQLTYSGRLLQNGALVNSTLPMDFYIYNHLTNSGASNVLWSTTNINVDVNQGIYSVSLGDTRNPISPNVFVTDNAYLQVVVNTEILSPRTKINSVGYAVQAGGLSNGGVQAVVVSTNGNIGIGTTNTLGRLTVKDISNFYVGSFIGSGSYATAIGARTNVAAIQGIDNNNAAANLVLQAEGGYLGVGTAAPTASLDILGTGAYAWNSWNRGIRMSPVSVIYWPKATNFSYSIGQSADTLYFGRATSEIGATGAQIYPLLIDVNGLSVSTTLNLAGKVGLGTSLPNNKLSISGGNIDLGTYSIE